MPARRRALAAALVALAAGARVQADMSATLSARGDAILLAEDEDAHSSESRIAGDSSTVLDVGGRVADPLCAYPKVSCEIPGLPLLGKWVLREANSKWVLTEANALAARGSVAPPPSVGDKVVAVKWPMTAVMGEHTEVPPCPDGQPKSDCRVVAFVESNFLLSSGIVEPWFLISEAHKNTILVIYKKMASQKKFVNFFNALLESEMDTADIDDVLYNSLQGKIRTDPSFIRQIAKWQIQGSKAKFLEYVLSGKEWRAYRNLPKFLDLLTDPEIYKEKKEGHHLKTIARNFRMEQMSKPKEEAAAVTTPLSKAELAVNTEEEDLHEAAWEAEVSRLLGELPSAGGSPAVATGAAVSAHI